MTRIAGGLTLALALLLPAAARAEVDRCSEVDARLAYHGALFQGLEGDTGWYPANSPAQLRVWGRIVGETNVDMRVRPTACWDKGMKLTVPGTPNGSWLDYAYGAELHVLAGIHTSVLGYDLNWEGEIPLPSYIPTDLLLANGAPFTGGANGQGSAVDATAPVTVFSTDVLRDYIGISGISGGLRITATGSMKTTYRTTELRANGRTVAGDAGIPVNTSTNTFGDALDVPLAAKGQLVYQPTITLSAQFTARFLGVTIIDRTLASYALPLPSIARDIELASGMVHIPLPNARGLAGSRIDFAPAATQRLPVHNSGEAPLVIEPAALPAGVTTQRIVVAPGADGALVVTAAADVFAAGGGATLKLVTNDPDNPTVDVVLGRDIGGTDRGEDTESTNESSAGCDAGAGGAGLGIALFALLARRRAQRGAPRVQVA
ncbi:MAG: hypothetical protein KF773_27675 [Deltaproteobacteria bacterium]|nr:hypothetical protein [Deltaproteobacteria bacterium]MCW5803897.1 hypothetical protein [Deltaproteobacteria bacterium]